MQIYLIDIGGDKQCWKAELPHEALELSLQQYCREAVETNTADSDDPPDQVWGRLFRSVERIGTLANP